MHVSYQKTLTKNDFCSGRILSLYTLNEHILLVKRDSETCRYLIKVLSWAHVRVFDIKMLYLSPSNIILMGF